MAGYDGNEQYRMCLKKRDNFLKYHKMLFAKKLSECELLQVTPNENFAKNFHQDKNEISESEDDRQRQSGNQLRDQKHLYTAKYFKECVLETVNFVNDEKIKAMSSKQMTEWTKVILT